MSSDIIITSPRPYQKVNAKFRLAGSVRDTKLVTSWGATDMRLFVDYIDIDGRTFMGRTIFVQLTPKILALFSKRAFFGQLEKFQWENVAFIEKSQGCITIKISGHELLEPIYVPLIVTGFGPEEGVSTEIAQKHAKIGQTIRQYEQDLRDYYKELEQISASRKEKDEDKEERHLYGESVSIASDILKILVESEDSFDEYTYSEEDRRERELEEKYKDALDWRGPLFRGIVSQFGGFELRVHSDDHGKHFHVIHKGKGIDVRFSFPDIQLVSYKSAKTTIGSRTEKKLRDYCLRPEIFQKFEREFNKQGQVGR